MAKHAWLALMMAAACASSGGGDDIQPAVDAPAGSVDAPGGNVDAPGGNVDAPGVPIDAPMGAATIGSVCTGEGQGSCPAGFECLNLVGGSGSWCSKRCTGVNDQSCSVGYTGPGHAACLLNVTPAGGGPAVPYCTILCFDAPGAPTYCPVPAACNNTCPTPLQCTGDIGMPVQARLCQ